MVSYGILLKQIVDGGCTKTIHNNLPWAKDWNKLIHIKLQGFIIITF
jgi:hypothetical protein